MNNFTFTETDKSEALKVPFFEDARADFAPYYNDGWGECGMKLWVLTYQYDNYNGMYSTYPYKVLGLFKTRQLAEQAATQKFKRELEWKKDKDVGWLTARASNDGDWLRLQRLEVVEQQPEDAP